MKVTASILDEKGDLVVVSNAKPDPNDRPLIDIVHAGTTITVRADKMRDAVERATVYQSADEIEF